MRHTQHPGIFLSPPREEFITIAIDVSAQFTVRTALLSQVSVCSCICVVSPKQTTEVSILNTDHQQNTAHVRPRNANHEPRTQGSLAQRLRPRVETCLSGASPVWRTYTETSAWYLAFTASLPQSFHIHPVFLSILQGGVFPYHTKHAGYPAGCTYR